MPQTIFTKILFKIKTNWRVVLLLFSVNCCIQHWSIKNIQRLKINAVIFKPVEKKVLSQAIIVCALKFWYTAFRYQRQS